MSNPVGHPSPYKPEYCETVKRLMREGLSKAEIAYELDVCRQTLDNWAKTHDEFFNAINHGVDMSEGWWSKQGRENLCNKDFNSRLWEINMMNRFGWMKRTDQNNNHSGNIAIEDVTERKVRNADEQYKHSKE